MTNTHYTNVAELRAALIRLRGEVCVDALAGNGYDPIEVAIKKSDLIATLGDYSPEAPAPFYLHVNSKGAQFLIAEKS